jgi:N-terminal acetyltransferase B complex catalytic subunit
LELRRKDGPSRDCSTWDSIPKSAERNFKESSLKAISKNNISGGAMTTFRAFTCDDLFRFNNINLDPLTETYGIPFYLQYLAHWPEYFIVAEAPGGELMDYIMGKAEGSVAREEWHGHVTAYLSLP